MNNPYFSINIRTLLQLWQDATDPEEIHFEVVHILKVYKWSNLKLCSSASIIQNQSRPIVAPETDFIPRYL